MDFIYEKNRIYAADELGNVVAEVVFPLDKDGVVNINRTFVDATLRGGGVAAKLLNLAYDHIKAQGLKARPTCSYAVSFFKRNEEKQDILADQDLDSVKIECSI